MKVFIVVICVLFCVGIYAQGTYLEGGGSLHIENGATWYTDGDVQLESNASINNNGIIELTRDWINNSGNIGLVNGSTGLVEMISNSHQIRGVDETYFYDLYFSGSNPFVEQFISSRVTNTLNIQDAQLETNNFNMFVTNPAVNSLLWNTGFVSSSTLGGHLVRSTNSVNTYRFPVGSLNLALTGTYRGVDITPTKTDSSVFGVRLAAIDASTETGISFSGAAAPYDRNLKHKNILIVNQDFYHNINRMAGSSPANIKIYYNNSDHPTADKLLEGVSQWKSSIPQWNFLPVNYNSNISGPADIGFPENSVSWLANTFDDDAFALSVIEGGLVFVPQIFSPNGDGINDVVFAQGRKVLELKYVIYNRWGEKVFESTDVNIGWDGTFRGQDAQSGVYVYYVEAEIEDYGPYSQTGNITLVR